MDYYTAYKELEQALLSKNTSSISNIDIIVNTFFPKRAPEPLCAIVKYTLISVDDLTNDTYTFLWTASYLPYATSVLLLSYSQSGISLKGFDWEKSCLIKSETQLVLEINSFNYSLDDVVFSALEDLTSQVLGWRVGWFQSRRLWMTEIGVEKMFAILYTLLRWGVVCIPPACQEEASFVHSWDM